MAQGPRKLRPLILLRFVIGRQPPLVVLVRCPGRLRWRSFSYRSKSGARSRYSRRDCRRRGAERRIRRRMLRMPWWRYVRRTFDGFFVKRWCLIIHSTVAISGSVYAGITALIARGDGRASVGGTDSDGYV